MSNFVGYALVKVEYVEREDGGLDMVSTYLNGITKTDIIPPGDQADAIKQAMDDGTQ